MNYLELECFQSFISPELENVQFSHTSKLPYLHFLNMKASNFEFPNIDSFKTSIPCIGMFQDLNSLNLEAFFTLEKLQTRILLNSNSPELKSF